MTDRPAGRHGLRHRLAGALAAWLCLAPMAMANETIRVVHTSSSTYTAGFVALDKGFFAAHGLDVTFVPIAINSNIPAALVSGSAEVGGTSTAVLIQAADGGLGLLAIAGTGLAYPGGTNEAAVARPDAGIHGPADYVGRRVGVPGIGVISDIFFRYWLIANHVDPSKVIYSEVANPQQFDALRSRSVDAVVANDPQLFRLIRSGTGVEAGRFLDALPGEIPIIVYAVTPDYAAHHRAAVLAFQAAHREGVAYVEQHPDEARAILARHLHLSDNVVKDMEMPKFQPTVSPEQIGRMIGIMQRLNMLQTHPDPKAMVFR